MSLHNKWRHPRPPSEKEKRKKGQTLTLEPNLNPLIISYFDHNDGQKRGNMNIYDKDTVTTKVLGIKRFKQPDKKPIWYVECKFSGDQTSTATRIGNNATPEFALALKTAYDNKLDIKVETLTYTPPEDLMDPEQELKPVIYINPIPKPISDVFDDLAASL